VTTTVTRTVGFEQTETFDITSTQYMQNIVQTTSVEGDTETSAGGLTRHDPSSYTYPFTFDYNYTVNPDGSSYLKTKSNQQDLVTLGRQDSGGNNLSNEVATQDTLNFDASGNFTGNTGAKSSEVYRSQDGRGGCYSETLIAAAGVLTSVSNGSGCHSEWQ
jgi:hypothetical protein